MSLRRITTLIPGRSEIEMKNIKRKEKLVKLKPAHFMHTTATKIVMNITRYKNFRPLLTLKFFLFWRFTPFINEKTSH